METLPCQSCKGLCCGPVPVTEKELVKIKRKIKSMPAKKRLELESQTRYFGTCIFYDLDQNRCGIYSVRPDVCRRFGHFKDLVCAIKPEAATKNAEKKNIHTYVGMLTIDFKWKNFK